MSQACYPSWGLPAPGRGRSRRVVLLLGAVVAISIGDLYMTLVHAREFGMMEGNPLARGMFGYNSALVLTLWKLATVALGAGILCWARRTRSGELGAWLCFVVMAWLAVHWSNYNHRVSEITGEMAVLAASGDDRFVVLPARVAR